MYYRNCIEINLLCKYSLLLETVLCYGGNTIDCYLIIFDMKLTAMNSNYNIPSRICHSLSSLSRPFAFTNYRKIIDILAIRRLNIGCQQFNFDI